MTLSELLYGLIGAVLLTWLTGFFNQFVPSPQRAWLFIKNWWSPQPRYSESDKEKFRFVLCWLEDDSNGENTKIVEQAFRDVNGIQLLRSACIVNASGAGDEWQPAMREDARKILEKWKADVAIIGQVKKAKEALSLWFVPRIGDDTLSRGDQPYKLTDATLQDDFRDTLKAQIVTWALTAAAPFADTETRGKILDTRLIDVIEKIEHLLKGGTIDKPEHLVARLCVALGTALCILGERESSAERIKKAVTTYQNALKEFPRERVPLDWAGTQNNLGNALSTLGERESDNKRLEQAVAAYKAALKELNRERVPLNWAMTHNNLGTALTTLGKRESDSKRLEQAVAAHKAALEERTREHVPLDWAMTKNKLGNALSTLDDRDVDS